MTTPDETLHFSDDEREAFRLRAKVRVLEECVRLSNESALQSAGRIRELEQRLTDDEVIEVCVNLEMGKVLSPEHRKSGREVITAVRAIRARGKS